MKFQEARRMAVHDGSVHVLSVAYAKVEEFVAADDELVSLELRLLDMRRRHIALREARGAAADAMYAALNKHYEGSVPRVVSFSNRMVIIDDSSDELRCEVAEHRGWADLFRIEPAADVAPAEAVRADAEADSDE